MDHYVYYFNKRQIPTDMEMEKREGEGEKGRGSLRADVIHCCFVDNLQRCFRSSNEFCVPCESHWCWLHICNHGLIMRRDDIGRAE